MMKENQYKNLFRKYHSSFILLNILLMITLIPNSLQFQTHICQEEFFLCNNVKCSKFGHCYYKSYLLSETLNKQIFEADCSCIQGYDTFPPNSKDDPNITKCCYKLKDSYQAFIYECIIGFGLGYFYLENYNIFFIKFILQMSLCCIVCFSGYCINFDYDKKENDKEINKTINRTCNIWNFILITILIVWRIFDFFIFGLNMVKDANGMRLYNDW